MRKIYQSEESKGNMKTLLSQQDYLPNDDVRVIDFCLRCENEKCNGDKCTALKLYERELRSKKKCQKNLRSKI